MTVLPAKGRLRIILDVAEDRRAKYRARADANAFEVAHSRHVPGIGSSWMRLRPQTAFCRPIFKILVQAVTARTRIRSIAGAS
jgi:hypothetical protein